MIVAVTSTVLFEVADEVALHDVRQHFFASNVIALNQPMETVSGLSYTMRALPALRVESAAEWQRRRETH